MVFVASELPAFHRTVDVLELVCEAVSCSFDNARTLLALRACSRPWAEAVSHAMRQYYCEWKSFEADYTDKTDEMSREAARSEAIDPVPARLCVVCQSYGAVRGWLRDIPAVVLRDRNPARLARDLRVVLSHVPRVSTLRFERNGSALSPEAMESIATIPAATLEGLYITCAAQNGSTANSPRRIPALPALQTLDVSNAEFMTDDVLAGVLRESQHLRTLRLQDVQCVSDAALVSVSKHCAGLVALRLAYCWRISEAGLQAVVTRCLHLRCLELCGVDVTDKVLQSVADRIPALQHLNVGGNKVTDEGLAAVARACTDLRFLQVLHSRVTDAGLSEVARHCRELRGLDIDSMPRGITDAAITAVGRGCPRLQRLVARDDRGTIITDTSLFEVARGCRDLLHVDVETYASSITANGAGAIAQHCRDFRHINLGSGGTVDAGGVVAIANACPDLRCVDLSCTRVSSDALTALATNCLRVAQLRIMGGDASDDAVAAAVQLARHTLRHLGLVDLLHVSDVTFAALAKFGSRLRSLELSSLPQVSTPALIDGLSGCAQLRRLTLGFTAAVTDDVLMATARHCPLLRSLHVSSTAIGDVSLVAVTPVFRELERLELKYLPGATDASLAALTHHCPQLQTVMIGGCPGISEYAADNFRLARPEVYVEYTE